MRFFLAAALLGLSLWGCNNQSPDKTADAGQPNAADQAPAGEDNGEAGKLDRSHSGQPAPAVGFEDPTGKKISLAQFAGKPLLVNLWATWCAPCVTELPTLDTLAGQLAGKVTVLAVSQDSSGRAKVTSFFDQHHYSALKPYLDSDMGLLNALKADTLPTTILYDPNGKEVWRVTGGEDWTGPRAKALLSEVEA